MSSVWWKLCKNATQPSLSRYLSVFYMYATAFSTTLLHTRSFLQLIPMWLPMIQSNLKVSRSIIISQMARLGFQTCTLSSFLFQHLSAGLQLRLQAIQNRVNHQCLQGQTSGAPPFALRKWLQCTQFKMAQVEIQSSEAASQFYPMWPPLCMHLPWLIPVTKRYTDTVGFIWTETLLAPLVKYLYMYSKSMLF